MWGLWLSAQRLQFVCQCVRAYVCLAVHCQSPMTAYFSQLVRRQVIGMFALLCDLVSVCVCVSVCTWSAATTSPLAGSSARTLHFQFG